MPRPISRPEPGSPRSRFIIHRSLPARSLLGLMVCLLCWHGLGPWIAPALAAEPPGVEWIRLEPSVWEPAQLPAVDLTKEAQGDVWLNATYAFGGSALSNGIVLVVILASTLLNEAFAEDAPDYLNMAGPLNLLLFGGSVIGTPLLMHAWSPEARHEQFAFSAIGSLVGTGLVALVMVPLALLFNQGNFNDTFLTLLPPAFIMAMLFQGLGSAWGHELGENLRRDAIVPGTIYPGAGLPGAGAYGGADPLAARPASPQGIVLLNQRWSF